MNQYNDPNQPPNQPQVALPNATAVLILGIVGIIACCCWGGGVILGIIALVLASKDLRLYKANPYMYTKNSVNNLNTGRICAIIAVVFSATYLLFLLFLGGTVGWEALQNPDAMRDAVESL